MCTYLVFERRLTKNRQTASYGSKGHSPVSPFKGAVDALREQESLVPISRAISSPSELQDIAYTAPQVMQTHTALSRGQNRVKKKRMFSEGGAGPSSVV